MVPVVKLIAGAAMAVAATAMAGGDLISDIYGGLGHVNTTIDKIGGTITLRINIPKDNVEDGQWFAVAVSSGRKMSGADHAFFCAKPSASASYELRRPKIGGYWVASVFDSGLATEGSTCSFDVDTGLTILAKRPLAMSEGGLDATEIKLQGLNSYIYAYGNCMYSGGSPTCFQHSLMEGHYGINSFDYAAGTASSSSGKLSTVIIVHAVVMGVAWVIFAPLVIMTARYFRTKGGAWFHLHRVFALLTVIATICGSILGFKEGGRNTTHYKVGVAICVVLLLQPLLGIARPDKSSQHRHKWYMVHAFLGVTLLVMAMAQIALGIELFAMFGKRSVATITVSVLYGIQIVVAIVCELGKLGIISLPWAGQK